MAQPIGPLTSTNNYNDNTLQGLWSSGFLFAGANPINVEIQYGTPEAATDTIHDLYCPAGQSVNFSAPSSQAYPNIYVTQVRFKSANAGQAATVSGYFNEPRAPAIIAGIGGGTPTNVALGVQHNDAAVASQPTLDFEDGGGLFWTVANDSPNTRVKVTPSISLPAIRVGMFSNTEVITSGALTDMLGDTQTVTTAGASVFSAALGSTTTVTIGANQLGFYLITLDWQWSADITPQGVLVFASLFNSGQAASMYGQTLASRSSFSAMGFWGSAASMVIHPQIAQTTGGNQTLDAWEMCVTRLTTGT